VIQFGAVLLLDFEEYKVMKTKFVLLALVVLLLVSGCRRRSPAILSPDADPAALPELVGTYVVNGVDPLGGEYGGHLTVWAGAAAGEYRLQWLLTGTIQEGEGVLDGNVLRVQWRTLEATEPVTGVLTYTITSAGELYGPRLAEGWAQPGQESAYPNQPQP
jgi:hypothetical protein